MLYLTHVHAHAHAHAHANAHAHTNTQARAHTHTHTHGVQLNSVEIYIYTYTCIHTRREGGRERVRASERESVCVWRGALYYVAAARWSLRPAAAGGMIEYDVRHPDSWWVASTPGSGFRVQGSEFRVQGSGSRVWGLGFRVAGARALSARKAQHVHAHGDTRSGE